MRIAIIASGSRGDVEPYVALGKGLADAGDSVRFVTQRDFEALVTSQGVEFWPAEGSVRDIAQSQEMRDLLERGNFLAIMSRMGREARNASLGMATAGLAACQGVDILVAGLGTLGVGLGLAEKLRLPVVQAYYVPFTPTRDYPFALFPKLPRWLGRAPNRLSFHLGRQIMWQPLRAADSAARREVLGLPPAPFWGPYAAPALRGLPILYGYSPLVIPPASDWGPNVHVTGYWFLDPPADWTPPAEVTEFLQAGPPPVYVGFGSMANRRPEETADLVLEALRRTGQRGIVLAGWGGIKKADLPDSVLMLDSIPHSWLFPRVAAVAHHGGAGTTSAGLRAGVPSIVIPFFADQPFWGQRVADLGVGPAPITRKALTADRLASAIDAAVSNQAMRRRAADLGAGIRAENGVAHAVEVIRRIG